MKKRISKEDLKKVKKLDLLSYLQTYEPDELVRNGNKDHVTRTHDSLHISNGMWTWWSQGIGGRSALDYLIKVREIPFLDAALYLKDLMEKKDPIISPIQAIQRTKSEFKLPIKNDNSDTLMYYLKNIRCIDKEIIQWCLDNKLIYECKNDHSVVFLGYDSRRLVSYAAKRSTYNDWKQDIAGSDKRYSFSIPNTESKTLRVFESAIDLLSYVTLLKQSGGPFLNEHFLSISGASLIGKSLEDSTVPIALETYLKEHDIKKIYLHLDNDRAGIETSQKIIYWLKDKYEIFNQPPKYTKDFNDVLTKRCNQKIVNKQTR